MLFTTCETPVTFLVDDSTYTDDSCNMVFGEMWYIVLYLKNFNTYFYLYIAEVMKYPEKILTPTRETELNLVFHSSWCNSYVTWNNNDITLIFKEDCFILPNAIHVPAILRHTLRTILSPVNHVELLIGSGSHFRVLNISSMENALVPPIEED